MSVKIILRYVRLTDFTRSSPRDVAVSLPQSSYQIGKGRAKAEHQQRELVSNAHKFQIMEDWWPTRRVRYSLRAGRGSVVWSGNDPIQAFLGWTQLRSRYDDLGIDVYLPDGTVLRYEHAQVNKLIEYALSHGATGESGPAG